MSATSQGDIDQLNLATLLRASLPWPEGADLDNIAPAVFRLPNGRDSEISYLDDNGEPRPTVRVRVQDVFGLDTHPLSLICPSHLNCSHRQIVRYRSHLTSPASGEDRGLMFAKT